MTIWLSDYIIKMTIELYNYYNGMTIPRENYEDDRTIWLYDRGMWYDYSTALDKMLIIC